jgi:hypothetical protein
MHGKLKRRKLNRLRSFWETGLLILIGIFTYVLVRSLRHHGIPDKWGTATLGTLIPFCFVVFVNRRRLNRWPFWSSLTTCLILHALLVWAIFQYVLSGIQRFSILLWYPFMLVEAFILLIAVKRIEEKLTGEHETIKVSL